MADISSLTKEQRAQIVAEEYRSMDKTALTSETNRLSRNVPVEAPKIYKATVYDDPKANAYQEKIAALRTFVRSAYKLQMHRVSMGNRLTANFRKKLGLDASDKETDDVQAHNVLSTLRKEYKKLTDAIIDFPKSNDFFKQKEGVITNIAELFLINSFIEASRIEREHFDALPTLLAEFPIYTEFLSKIYGMGPSMAAILISEINIYKAKYPSSIERYMGIDTVKVVNPDTGVVRDEGRSNREAHLVMREYVARDGTIKTRRSITYNSFLKTKVVGVLGPILLKLGKRVDKKTGAITYLNQYAKHYDDYKVRINARDAGKEKQRTKAHLHSMANRYMVKIFVKDLYEHWRPLEGLSMYETYAVAVLGHKRHNSPASE